MSKDYSKELKDMERLINYGMTESKRSNDKGIVEYSQMGADGKTYGVIREGTKYYVKVAPKKNTAVLAEDYDYIGGFNNRKSYDSYTKASQELNFKLMSVNEANGSKKPVKSQFSINESAEWQTPMTKEARKELNRFYQLNANVDKLLNENVHWVNEEKKDISVEGGDPFSKNPTKAKTSVDGKGGSQQNLGIKNKSFTNGGKQVNPESEYNSKGVKGNSPSGKYCAACGNDNNNGNPYTEKAKGKIKDGMKGGVNESEHEVLAWRPNERAFVHRSSDSDLDRSHGTEIGDTAPWTDSVNEGFETDDWGSEGLPGTPGTGEPKKYKKPWEKNTSKQPVDEQYIFEVEIDGDTLVDELEPTDDEFKDDDELEPTDDEFKDDDELEPTDGEFEDDDELEPTDGEFEDDDELEPIDGNVDYQEGIDDGLDYSINGNSDIDDAEYPDNDEEDPTNDFNDEVSYEDDERDPLNDIPSDDDGDMNESKEYVFEVTLDDFGKHPAYRKKPMTLPTTGDSSEWGRDWNDESTKSEKPFGVKIGDTAPFNQMVDKITNAVVSELNKKKS